MGRKPGEEIPPKRPIVCPECLAEWKEPEELSVHLERHREVRKPDPSKVTRNRGWKVCPKGCGRHLFGIMEYREHAGLCDGSPPLPAGKRVEENMPEGQAGYPCPDCGRTFSRPNTFAIHRKAKHGSGLRPGGNGPTGGLSEDEVMAKLREKAREHRSKADRLEGILKELETLL